MPANYPTADPSFSAKSAGSKIQSAHINALQDEVIAIGAALRGTLQHNVTTANSIVGSSNLSIGGNSTLTGPVTCSTNVTISTGTLTLGQGQIVFPATQVASAGANTLDDYKENTWTPSLGGTTTYSVQSGKYTKVGRFVHLTCHLTITLIGSGFTGKITGSPFTPTEITAGSMGYFSGAASSFVWAGCYIAANGEIHITGLTAAGGTVTDSPTFFGNGTDVYLTVGFFV